jgi:3'-5' exoribonuclease
MSKRFIRELKEKEHVQSPFLVTEKTAGTDRNGKSFLSLTLADASGHLNARMFEKVDEFKEGFESGDAVWIKGFVQVFQNRKQIILHEVRKAEASEFNMSELVADLSGDPQEHMKVLLTAVSGLKNEFIRQLLHLTLTDAQVSDLLLKMPAAKTIHHAYRGGLIEHICSIVKVMEAVSALYDFLDRDLLIFGAIYHDIGKIFELDLEQGIHYTQAGRLVGHMVLACELMDQKSALIPWFPRDLKDVLKHIILSHHGKLEYGSPKLPMMAEAVMVSMIDDLDSKMNTLFHFLKNEIQNVPKDEKWSHYHPGFERYFFLDFFRRRLGV